MRLTRNLVHKLNASSFNEREQQEYEDRKSNGNEQSHQSAGGQMAHQ